MALKNIDGVTPAVLGASLASEKGMFQNGNEFGHWLAYGLFDKLAKAIASDKIVFACIGSSMTSRIKNAMGVEHMDKWGGAPLPCNFLLADDKRSVTFDFPEVYDCGGGIVLHFEDLMCDRFESAAEPGSRLRDDSVRRLRPGRLRRAEWVADGGILRLTFGLSDSFTGAREWFDFVIVSECDVKMLVEKLNKTRQERKTNTGNGDNESESN